MKKQKENKLEIRVPHNVKKVLLDRQIRLFVSIPA